MPRKPGEKCLHLIKACEASRAYGRLSSPVNTWMSDQGVLVGSPKYLLSVDEKGWCGLSREGWGLFLQQEEKGRMKIRASRGESAKVVVYY